MTTKKGRKSKYPPLRICEFCHHAQATTELTARVPDVPDSESQWHVCNACALAVLERMTGVPASR